MRFYANGVFIDSEDTPLIVILTKEDKANIANMVDGATVYCAYKPGDKLEEIKELMKKVKKEHNEYETSK